MKPRKYRMRRRAQSQGQTRQKIVEATAELHGTVGPRNTTISAVAEKAGVQRLTVYRHFPDEASLFRACSSHWLSNNPPPDPAEWQHVESRRERSTSALNALYAYYRETESMWSLVYRDADLVPAMDEPLAEFHAYLAGIRNDLCASWHPVGRRPASLEATTGHVLEFGTWSSLDRLDVDNSKKVRLALCWIESVLR